MIASPKKSLGFAKNRIFHLHEHEILVNAGVVAVLHFQNQQTTVLRFSWEKIDLNFDYAIDRDNGCWRVKKQSIAKVKGFCPNIDYSFNTMANVKCEKVAAGILTGMGRDGAKGLKSVRQKGGMTFSQDEQSSLIYGMPKAAAESGASQYVGSIRKITQWIKS